MNSEANTVGSDGSDNPPLRSQSELNEPPVEPWPEPVDGKALLDELRQYMRRFAVLPRWAAEILPPFVVHTYAFELRDVSTYIGIESPERRCGKSTLMILLSELVNRPEPAANISSPAFYRAIQEMQPTLLIDESDKHLKGNQQLQGILNSGYSRKMAYVLRVTNQKVESGQSGDEGGADDAKSKVQSPKSKAHDWPDFPAGVPRSSRRSGICPRRWRTGALLSACNGRWTRRNVNG